MMKKWYIVILVVAIFSGTIKDFRGAREKRDCRRNDALSHRAICRGSRRL